MESNAEQSVNPVVQMINNNYQESYHAKRNRMYMNADNFNCYHLKQDYTHKKAGQSKEFLGKQYMAVEQITSFMAQGLMDEKDWFEIEDEDGVVSPKIKGEEMEKLLEREFRNNNINTFIPDAVKLGLLGSLMIVKVHGAYEVKPKFFTKEGRLYRGDKKCWRLKLELIRQEDWYPDPTGEGLYDIQAIEMDWYQLKKIAQENPDQYDMEEVENCGTSVQIDQKAKKSRETDQNATFSSYRRRVRIKEFWGDLIEQGTGRVLYRNVVCAVANDHHLIRPPRPNPFWHQKRPFLAVPIIRVPHSVWHKAAMDAPTKHNRALNELHNLMFDSAMMSTFGIKQLRESWLDDPSEVDEGIFPGTTLKVNSSCPPGMKVLEQVATGGTPQESIQMFNLTNQEFQTSALTSDLRMGVLPNRQVKATEIVASNQSITGIFNGLVKNIETAFIEELIKLSWLTCAQFLDDLNDDEMKSIFGEERAIQIGALTPEERFAETASGYKYRVFGMSTVLNKINDFRKITSLLQTMAQSPVLVQEFAKQYDFGKLLTQVAKSLEIDTDKIKKDEGAPPQGPQNPNGQASPQDLAAMTMASNGQGGPGSQQPQMAATGPQSMPGVQHGPPKMGSTTPGSGA